MIKLHLDGPNVETYWPVTSGIPFPKGHLHAAALTLTDPDGQAVSCQMTPTSYWEDGSIRWLLLDLTADMRQAGQEFTLDAQTSEKPAAVEPQPQLRVEENIGVTEIESEIQAVLPHRSCEILKLSRPGCSSIRELRSSVTEAGGPMYSQAAPTSLYLETKGLIRSTVFTSGHYHLGADALDAPYQWQYRIHLFAGLPLVRLEYSLINQAPNIDGRYLKDVSLQLPLEHLAADVLPNFRGQSGRCLKQLKAEEGCIDDRPIQQRYPGTMQLGDISVITAEFWQRYPKALELQDQTLLVHTLADSSTEGMFCAQGEGQTHDIWLWLGEDAPDQDTLACLVSQRPLLVAPADWMCCSEVFGLLPPYSRSQYPDYEKGVEQGFAGLLKQQEARNEFGYRDYGDTRYDKFPEGWLNNEYDWAHGYFLQFARTGDRRYFDFAASRARHMMDTDIIHYQTPPRQHLIGAPHIHHNHHTPGEVDIGHSWLEGLFDYWNFLGDRRAYDHGVNMAEFYTTCVGHVNGLQYKDQPGARRPGWGMIALAAAYHNTLCPRYLAALDEIVQTCAREQTASGAWVYPGGGLDDPGYMVGKTFMVALTLTGLQRYHELTGDSQAADMLLKGLDWAIDAMWDEEIGGFRTVDTPFDSFQRGPGSQANHILEPLAYAYKLTGSLRYQYVASRTFEQWLKHKPALGPTTIRDMVHYLADHRETPDYQGDFPLYSLQAADSRHIRRFWIVNEQEAWAVGLYGLLLHTTDAGRSWQTVDLQRNEHLYGIYFSGAKGVAVGEGEVFCWTDDGGEHWYTQTTDNVPPPNKFVKYYYDVHLDGDCGYAAGQSQLLQTTDGGATWERIWHPLQDSTFGKSPKLMALAKQGEQWWIVGTGGLSLTMDRLGRSFTHQPALPHGYDIFFLDEQFGWATGESGAVYMTTDGGKHWSSRKLCSEELWQVRFADHKTGYAVGNAGLLFTTQDGGHTWTRAALEFNGQLRAIGIFSKTQAVAAGNDGVLFLTCDGGTSWIPQTY